jgi:hypothetical protein
MPEDENDCDQTDSLAPELPSSAGRRFPARVEKTVEKARQNKIGQVCQRAGRKSRKKSSEKQDVSTSEHRPQDLQQDSGPGDCHVGRPRGFRHASALRLAVGSSTGANTSNLNPL